MKPYAQEAENLRLLFEAGIVSIDNVVAWADRTISTLPEYDDDLVEISLGAKAPRDEMEGRLHRVSAGADTFEAIRNLAGRMHHILLSDRSRAGGFARLLADLWAENDYTGPKDLRFMDRIDDSFDLADSGQWGSPKEVIDELIVETAPFDTATPVPTPPLPTSRSSQSESSQKRGKSVIERLRRFLRGGSK